MTFKILFYDDGDPMDHRCIKRFVSSFSPVYSKTVQEIIPASQTINEQVFKRNAATLLPSFGMTRTGIFHGIRISGSGQVSDPNNILDKSWKAIGEDLKKLQSFVQQNVSCKRSRVLRGLSGEPKKEVVAKISTLFDRLSEVSFNNSNVGRVGASKILFAIFPEVALPVDNSEWDHVFRTDKYANVITTMINEIEAWENKTGNNLQEADPHTCTTLPSVYNVMAMSVRPID
jgi:hypothetical protein